MAGTVALWLLLADAMTIAETVTGLAVAAAVSAWAQLADL